MSERLAGVDATGKPVWISASTVLPQDPAEEKGPYLKERWQWGKALAAAAAAIVLGLLTGGWLLLVVPIGIVLWLIVRKN